MSKILIAGASGMIGSSILDQCLRSDRVDIIHSIVRSSSNPKTKVREFLHKDFAHFADSEEAFKDIDAAFFTIGLYQGTVHNDLFKKVTVDYAIAFADQLKKSSPRARLCFLSGAGADRQEKSRMKFARFKGMAENHLIRNLNEVYIFRPAYIYPVQKRKEPSLAYGLFRSLYPLMKHIAPKSAITSDELAQAMFEVGITGHNLQTLENEDIKGVLSEISA